MAFSWRSQIIFGQNSRISPLPCNLTNAVPANIHQTGFPWRSRRRSGRNNSISPTPCQPTSTRQAFHGSRDGGLQAIMAKWKKREELVNRMDWQFCPSQLAILEGFGDFRAFSRTEPDRKGILSGSTYVLKKITLIVQKVRLPYLLRQELVQ